MKSLTKYIVRLIEEDAEQVVGQSGCLSKTVGNYGANDTDIYNSRYGSGETNSQQDWSHWSDAAGGSVGGTGDGCVYTSFGHM